MVIGQNAAVEEATNFINSVLSKGEPWTDPDFPPEKSSLMKEGEKQYNWTDFWLRAPKIYKNVDVFHDGADIKDIK